MSERFNVYQWFQDGTREDVLQNVLMERACETFMGLVRSVGAHFGTTVRVIITDQGDCTNMEWKKGEGIVFPPELVGREKH